ncbi:Protein CBG20578 [Caenorhabditis briggsae]|uniref:Protein CBG20578 n=1 Tax=Caenorhabditis briggsae TaxID=6238 RepID=A8XY46_CAEBR|nr:Protein CBG20578 [Caenorhabditis briggsae]CAP37563.2 Protein CBG20578 [Caenorhabditis briggsae]
MPYSRIAASAVDTAVLGEPLTFRHGKQAKNRIMKSPLSEKLYQWNAHSEDQRGIPTEEIINLYSHWGHGGYGIILTGNLGVDPNYVGEAGQGLVTVENTNEESQKQLRRLAEAMRLVEDWRLLRLIMLEDWLSLTIPIRWSPLEFSIEEIEEKMFKRFAHAASVLYEAGFDGMELHSAHGMVFNQFLLPKNQRADDYGGSIENRIRLLVNTYKAVREVVPASTGFLVGVKLNSRDFQECGIPREDIVRVCELIEDAGFDFVELTGGAMETVVKEAQQRESTIARENFFLDFVQFTSKIFQKTVVYITGRWQTANAMVESVKMGLTQGVGLGRWSCAEPDFPKKLLAGDIHSCPDYKFALSEFGTMKLAAHWQMKQLAQKNYAIDSR